MGCARRRQRPFADSRVAARGYRAAQSGRHSPRPCRTRRGNYRKPRRDPVCRRASARHLFRQRPIAAGRAGIVAVDRSARLLDNRLLRLGQRRRVGGARRNILGTRTTQMVAPRHRRTADRAILSASQGEEKLIEIQALVHDVFGTVVDWRSAVTADGEALAARNGITGVDWQQVADQWRGLYAPSMNKVRTGELPWTNLDALHRMALDALLDKFGIAGKLSEEDKVWFNLTWHRLKPWPDSVPGLTR